MKKFIFSLLTFILLGITLGGGVFLLAGCDYSQSQEENNQENENNSDSENDNNDEDADGGSEKDGGNGNSDDNIEEFATDQDFYIQAQIRTSNTSWSVVAAGVEENRSKLLRIWWYDENGTAKDWGDDVTFESFANTSQASSGYVEASYVHGQYKSSGLFSKTYKRYAKIMPAKSDYLLDVDMSYCGMATSSTWDNSDDQGSLSTNCEYYAYNSTCVFASKPAASSVSSTTKFRVYMRFRAQYRLDICWWDSPGVYGSPKYEAMMDAGTTEGVLARGYDFKEIPGYEVIGLSYNANSTPSFYFDNGYLTLPETFSNSAKTLYAIYAPEIKIYAYYTSDYSNFYNGSTGGTVNVQYTSTSGGNSSISSVYNNSFYARYNSAITLTSTSKSGYVFRGWFDSTSASTLQGSPLSSSSRYTFYPTTGAPYARVALFVRYQSITMYNRYTTTYDTISLGGTGGSIKVSYTNTLNSASSYTFSGTSTAYSFSSVYSKTVTLTATANSGYQFVGWYSAEPSVSSESTSRFSTSTSYSFTASTRSSVYGLFAKTYTLTIKYAYGGYTHSTNITATNSSLGLSQTLSSNGSYALTTYCRPSSQTITISRVNTSYTYYMGNGSASTGSITNSYQYLWSTTANATVNVYVREQYKITYNGNGNTGGSGPAPNPVSKAHGLNITLPTNSYTKTGYTANGWNTNAAGTGTHYNNGASYSGNGNATLYAQWTANTYYVKFNGNGATSGSMSNQTFTYDKAQNLTANAFAKTGYTFAGWATSASGSVAYTDKQSVKNLTSSNGETVNLYAKWNVVSYTITYNENGGNTVSDLSYTIESTSTLTSTTRTGYTFNGWKPKASSGSWSSATTYKAGESVNGRYGNVELVAQWIAKQYTLTLKGNGGTPDTQVMSPKLVFDLGNWSDVAGNRPTRTGFTFTGFYTSATGGEKVYDANGQCVNGNYWQNKQYKHDGDLTVYAHWQANNPAYYDEEGGYWYVELGMFPQSRVTDQTIINGLTSGNDTGKTYTIAGKTLNTRMYNGEEYCYYKFSENDTRWYKVEPIRWRLAYSSSQKSGYGTTTDTFAVLDTIVYAGQYSATEIGLNSGYVTTTLDEFKKNITSTTYLATFSANVESFSPTGTTSSSQSANVFISSADEISSALNNKTGSAKYSVKFSDLVSDILGDGIKQYYTRNLGSNISTIKSYTELGMPTQNLCTNLQGVQFTIKVSEYGCV